MKIRFILVSVLLMAGAAVFTAPARAEDLGAVKSRMVQRISKIDSLKAEGAIGENNRGYLDVRGGGGDSAQVVAAENADRQTVYAAIAKQTGSSAEAVGQARAKQIAAGSAKGVWLQKEDGSWYRK